MVTSQEGLSAFAALKLGMADEHADELAARLQRWQWPDASFPVEAGYYRDSGEAPTGCSLVGWGVTGARRMNESVTVNALYVLSEAVRSAL